jgi:hypothetical protein
MFEQPITITVEGFTRLENGVPAVLVKMNEVGPVALTLTDHELKVLALLSVDVAERVAADLDTFFAGLKAQEGG